MMGISPLDLVVFFIVLGVLVFVHELGHFLAAKACGIYVDRFSLGMPPRLFGFRYKDTDYCIGLLPIGGYVKMAGQEDQPLSEEERHETYGHVPPEKWYNNKPVWQRAMVLIAGPAMNIVLALCIYGFIGAYGREVSQAEVETRIGAIEPESPASTAPLYLASGSTPPDMSGEPDATGWRTGDRLISIDGEPVEKFQDILVAAILGGGKKSLVEIERRQPDGSAIHYVSPVVSEFLDEDAEARRFGVAPYMPALVRHVFPGSPAKDAGLEPDDEILAANGSPIDQPTFSELVRGLPDGATVEVIVLRDGKELPVTVQTRQEGSFKDILFDPQLGASLGLLDGEPLTVVEDDNSFLSRIGLRKGEKIQSVDGSDSIGTTLRRLLDEDPSRSIVASVAPGSGNGAPRAVKLSAEDAVRALTSVDPELQPVITAISPELGKATGLQRKDRVVEIDGKPATATLLREMERTRVGETVSVVLERPAILFGLYQKKSTLKAELTIAPIQQIGVLFGPKMVFRREAPADVIPFAIDESYRQVKQIGGILTRLLTGQLNPKLLGGPVMIGDIVTTAYQIGFFYLLDITAMISVNLAVFNLLPLPILDGGQLVLLGVEGIRRKPVNTRFIEAVQQVGFLFIIGLLLFVTFNDVSRIVGRFLP